MLSTVRLHYLPVSISNTSVVCIQSVGNKSLENFIPVIFSFCFISVCVHVVLFNDQIIIILFIKERQLGVSSGKNKLRPFHVLLGTLQTINKELAHRFPFGHICYIDPWDTLH